MKKTLRQYQRESIDALYDAWNIRNDRYLIVLPTGTGKSLTLSVLITELFEKYGQMRTLVLHPTKELIQQNYQELLDYWPYAPAGIYSAGLKRKDLDAPVLFAGIQSIYRCVDRLDPAPQLVIIDECFTGDTLINTPRGKKRIDSLKIGDYVNNATGIGVVENILIKEVKELYEIKLNSGRVISCTGNHRFFTGKGYIEARNLEFGQDIFSEKTLSYMWDRVLSVGYYKVRKNKKCNEGKLLDKAKNLLKILFEETKKSYGIKRVQRKSLKNIKKNRTQTKSERWKRTTHRPANKATINNISRFCSRITYKDRLQSKNGYISNVLQSRYRMQKAQDRNRIRWSNTLRKAKRIRQEKGFFPGVERVESVSYKKQGSLRVVYDLQVSGHPSYYAEGVLVHNCHTIPRKSDTMYQKVLSTLRLMNPNLAQVGFTATNFRLNCGYLHIGDDKIFDSIVYEYTIQKAIDDGFLSPITAYVGSEEIDVTGVHKRGGEFIESELQEASCKITREAVNDIVQKGKNRKKWIVFATGVDHAEQIKQELETYDISCETVTGQTSNRDRVIQDFKDDKIKCLININILLTGFNVPAIDLIVWLRPTNSPVLWVQGNGRGTRLHPGKTDCLVLDYSGNGVRLGPIDAVKVRDSRSAGDGVAPAKICDDCFAIVPAGVRNCPLCGFEFPPPKPELYDKHKESAILKDQIKPVWYNVESTSLHVHSKPGKVDSVRVQYRCGLNTISEWIFPEANNQAGVFYFNKFCQSVGIDSFFGTAENFVETQKINIGKILVKNDGKYDKVIDREIKINDFVKIEEKEVEGVPLF